MKKSIFKSKTFWVNLALAVAPLFPALAPLLNEQVLLQVVGVVNVVLRLVTSQPVALKGE